MSQTPTHHTPAGEPVRQRLRGLTHLLLDLDGTLHLDGRLFDATLPFLDTLDAMRIGYTCLTNNSSRSSQDFLTHLRRMGLRLKQEQIITSTQVALSYLKQHHPDVTKLFVLGTPAMQEELAQDGMQMSDDAPQAVLVGLDQTLTYDRLCKAAWWISKGLPFLATHPDVVCPTRHATMLVDCGAICRALHAATGIAPVWLGKPTKHVLPLVQQRTGASHATLAMVGDRLSTDIALACDTGMFGVLVLTGEATAADLPSSRWQPDLVVPDVGHLAAMLRD